MHSITLQDEGENANESPILIKSKNSGVSMLKYTMHCGGGMLLGLVRENIQNYYQVVQQPSGFRFYYDIGCGENERFVNIWSLAFCHVHNSLYDT